METVTASNEKAVNVTKGKLHAIALKMAEGANALAKAIRRADEQQDPKGHTLEAILLEKAEIVRLEREVNEVLRDHQIDCGCCGQKHMLREVRAIGVIPNVSLLCPRGFHKGHILEAHELESIKGLLKFAFCNPKEIFDTAD